MKGWLETSEPNGKSAYDDLYPAQRLKIKPSNDHTINRRHTQTCFGNEGCLLMSKSLLPVEYSVEYAIS